MLFSKTYVALRRQLPVIMPKQIPIRREISAATNICLLWCVLYYGFLCFYIYLITSILFNNYGPASGITIFCILAFGLAKAGTLKEYKSAKPQVSSIPDEANYGKMFIYPKSFISLW
jgi:hypothetical protein